MRMLILTLVFAAGLFAQATATFAPNPINQGNTSTFSWSCPTYITEGVSKLLISADIDEGTGTYFSHGAVATGSITGVTAATTWRLKCRYESTATELTASDTLVVIVPEPTVDVFTFTPPLVIRGGSTTLTWTCGNYSTGADLTPALAGWPGGTTGSYTFTPASSTVYTLTCANSAGSATANRTISVLFPMIQIIVVSDQ